MSQYDRKGRKRLGGLVEYAGIYYVIAFCNWQTRRHRHVVNHTCERLNVKDFATYAHVFMKPLDCIYMMYVQRQRSFQLKTCGADMYVAQVFMFSCAAGPSHTPCTWGIENWRLSQWCSSCTDLSGCRFKFRIWNSSSASEFPQFFFLSPGT